MEMGSQVFSHYFGDPLEFSVHFDYQLTEPMINDITELLFCSE